MKNFSFVFAVVLLLSISFTANAFDGEQDPDISDPTTACWCTFTSPGDGGTTVCISKHGNVVKYNSPTGFEHVGVGAFSEGYVLCNGAVNRYDTGTLEVGFAEPISAICTPPTATITRNTLDGTMQLKQDFSFNGMGKQLQVSMTVKNLTAALIASVTLRRQVDFDVDAYFGNYHANTEKDGVFAWNDPNDALGPEGDKAHGMILRHLSGPTAHNANVTLSILDSACVPTVVNPSPAIYGDYGDTIRYNFGTIGAGASKKAIVRYERY